MTSQGVRAKESICRQPGSGRPSKVTCEVKDPSKNKWPGGLKLEISIPTQHIFAKRKGGLVF